MKLVLDITTWPPSSSSFDAEDELENILTDRGIQSELEHVIGREIEEIMKWRDISVEVSIVG